MTGSFVSERFETVGRGSVRPTLGVTLAGKWLWCDTLRVS